MSELFDVVLVKYTGLAGRAAEVNSISYKTVDSAVYHDSIDALNYPVRAPYGSIPKNLSYENWIKFKLRVNLKYRKCLDGTVLHLPCGDCDDHISYTKIKNPRLWLKFKCFSRYEIKYGFTTEYSAPIRSESEVAVNNIRALRDDHYNEEFSIVIPLGNTSDILIGEVDEFESDFFVTQLAAYKGCQFENSIMELEFHYDLA